MSITLKPIVAQRIVITGASSGIGLAIAEAAAAAGARLLLTARNEAALREIADRLSADGTDVAILATDIADDDAAERIAVAATERFGGFDTWVNNAAAGTFGTVTEVSIADQRRIFDVGYWGLVAGSLAAARRLRQTGGAIINIGSVLGDRTMIQQGPYSAMKHAVKGFTDALRVELLEAGAPVSVTLIKPSAMHTPFPQHARNYMDAPARLPPMLYDPRLVARAVLFAAAHPRRSITVGAFGEGATLGDMLAPGLLDVAMAAGGTRAQQIDQPLPATVADNLWEGGSNGAIESDHPQFVRRTSLWLEAQLRPGTAALVAAGTVAGLAALAASARRAARPADRRVAQRRALTADKAWTRP